MPPQPNVSGEELIRCEWNEENEVAKGKKQTPARKPYTAADVRLLKQHSKARTPVPKIAKQMKRTEGSLRQKAKKLGIGLGHQR